MTVVCFPLNAVSGAPVNTGRLIRETLGALLGGASSTRPLGAFSGVKPGTPTNTVTLAGSNWTCKPHAGILDVQAAAEAGPYFYAVTANETGTLNAAHASLVRTDLLVQQLSDPAESDGTSTPQVQTVYVAGTAGAGTPATPARSMVVARFNVPQSGGGSPTVTWVAPTLYAAGARASVATIADLGTLSAYTNMEATVEATPGAFWKHNGTSWIMHGVARFADAALRDAAITAPVTGSLSRLATERFTRRYTGAAWKPFGSRAVPIIPTGVAGSGVTLNAEGRVVFTGATAVSVNGCYPTEFDEIEERIYFTTSAAAAVTKRLRVGGVDDATSNYDIQVDSAAGATASAVQVLAQSSWSLLGVLAIGQHWSPTEMGNPAAALPTAGLVKSRATANPMSASAAAVTDRFLLHRSSTAFDGESLAVASGTMTGWIEYFGIITNT